MTLRPGGLLRTNTARTDQLGSRNWYYRQDDLGAIRPADHLEAMRGLGLLSSVILLAGLEEWARAVANLEDFPA
jgi:hypothetical protein